MSHSVQCACVRVGVFFFVFCGLCPVFRVSSKPSRVAAVAKIFTCLNRSVTMLRLPRVRRGHNPSPVALSRNGGLGAKIGL